MRLVVHMTFAALAMVHLGLMAVQAPNASFNQAVRIEGGQRVVEVAPFPAHMKHAVKNFKRPEDVGREVSVASIETPDGLMDCYGTLWYHAKACSKSTFGRQVLDRTWIVKMNGQWFACGSHRSAATCVQTVVDGQLRPIPSSRE